MVVTTHAFSQLHCRTPRNMNLNTHPLGTGGRAPEGYQVDPDIRDQVLGGLGYTRGVL